MSLPNVHSGNVFAVDLQSQILGGDHHVVVLNDVCVCGPVLWIDLVVCGLYSVACGELGRLELLQARAASITTR